MGGGGRCLGGPISSPCSCSKPDQIPRHHYSWGVGFPLLVSRAGLPETAWVEWSVARRGSWSAGACRLQWPPHLPPCAGGGRGQLGPSRGILNNDRLLLYCISPSRAPGSGGTQQGWRPLPPHHAQGGTSHTRSGGPSGPPLDQQRAPRESLSPSGHLSSLCHPPSPPAFSVRASNPYHHFGLLCREEVET